MGAMNVVERVVVERAPDAMSERADRRRALTPRLRR
jgi:hypothetical protein